MKTRPRDLRNDRFIASLVKKKAKKEEKRRPERTGEVTVDTQEEHEVAEALYCLANIRVQDLPIERRSTSESEGLRSKQGLSRRKPVRQRRTAGVSKRRAAASRRVLHDEASISSDSYERVPRTRTRSRSGRVTTAPFRRMFREGGRRVYHSQSKPPPSEPIRRHVIHQQPQRPRQKTQPTRVETSAPERVMLNGHCTAEDRGALSDERYLPVAVMDALKGAIGRGLICTKQEEPQSTHSLPPKPLIPSPHVTSIQLKCEERSNENAASGTPLAQPKSNNARHIFGAHLIQSMLDKCKHEVSFPGGSALSFGQSRIEDVVKNLPLPPVQEEPSGVPTQFYPSLPIPSSFSSFSMSLPSLPQTLIQSLQNSAAHVTSLQPRFPTFTGQAPPGAPPPLVRASEPWETNR